MLSAAAVQQIEASIAELIGRDVECIRWRQEDDHCGNPALFFNVVLADHAARNGMVRRAAYFVETRLRGSLWDLTELFCYFNYRSHSEQAELQDPDWMPLEVSQ